VSSLVWDELVGAALLGTERRSFAGDDLPAALRHLPGAGNDLVTAASAVWAYQEAGRVPATWTETNPPDAAPVDDRGWLPAQAVRGLEAILGDRRFRPLLPEWLTLAARHGGRLPPELVPPLLDAGRAADPDLVAKVAGPLARWLAARNPDWTWVNEQKGRARFDAISAEGLADRWEANDEDRVAAFAAARASDPAGARAFIEVAIADEPASTRAAIVNAFASGLSLDDEPFLELRLADGRKDVRRAAAALLSKLPGSRMTAALEAEALAAVKVERGRLLVDLGDSDAVAVTRLARWVTQLERSPEDLVRLALRSGAAGLVRGWATAAVAQDDAVWATALLAGGAPATGELLQVVPRQRADRFVMAILEEWKLGPAVPLLLSLPVPWSGPLTQAVLAALGSAIAAGDMTGREALPAFALAVDVRRWSEADALPAAFERVPEARRVAVRSFWGRRVANLLAVIHFRRAMYEALR
jgi:hypothetical protein